MILGTSFFSPVLKIIKIYDFCEIDANSITFYCIKFLKITKAIPNGKSFL